MVLKCGAIVDPLDDKTSQDNIATMAFITVENKAEVSIVKLGEHSQKKMSQIVEKVHNFLDPPPLG